MPTLTEFAGAWRLERGVDDARAGARGRLGGRAWFTEGEGGLVYEEAGRLRMEGGAALEARQRHLWREGAAGIEVAFADGRPFHAFDPSETAPRARHDCPPDLYLVRYDFARWPDWQAEWRVSGPAKSYRLVSHYTRA